MLDFDVSVGRQQAVSRILAFFSCPKTHPAVDFMVGTIRGFAVNCACWTDWHILVKCHPGPYQDTNLEGTIQGIN